MNEQEQRLVSTVADRVYTDVEYSRNKVVDYARVSKETRVPISIIQTIAKQICNYLLECKNVIDCDITDGNCFDIMLNTRTV